MEKLLLAAAALLSLPAVHAVNGIERLTLPGNQYYYGGYGNNWLAADGHSAILGGDMMMGGSYYYSASAGVVALEQIITGVPSNNYYHGQLYGYSSDGTKLLYRSYSGNLNGDYLINATAGTSQLVSVAAQGYTQSRGLSANGLYVVGSAYTSGNNTVSNGFVWSAAGTPVTGIGAGFANDSNLLYVNNDGTLALGGFWNGSNAQAFVWKQAGNTETSFAQIANLSAGQNSYLTYVTADLSVALLQVNGNSTSTIYRWSPVTAQFTHLDLSAVSANCDATGLSADGSTVIAQAGSKVHRWTATGWDLDLTASLTGVQSAYSNSNNYYGYGNGLSTNISADGKALVGIYYYANNTKPFYWSTTTGAIDLLASMPNAQQSGPSPIISADGKVVFGSIYENSTSNVFRWSAARGTQTLSAWLQSYGVDLTPFANWTFQYATATSPDGAVLLGTARESQGMSFPFIATAKGVTDVNAWMGTVVGANSFYAMGYELSHLPMEGAHHRTLASYGDLGGLSSFWATGDFGGSSEGAKSEVSSGEVGVSTALAPQLIVGLAAGRGRQSQELALGGSSLVEGNYVFFETDYKFAQAGVLSVTLSAGSWKGELDRGYLVGANVDHSIGHGDANSRAARLRYDTPFYKVADKFSVGAFGSYTWTALKVDAYAEEGGAFPATYDRQEHTAREGRLGLVGVYVVNESLEVRLSAELVHRYDGAQPSLTGTDVTGNLPFSMAGTQNVANQGRYGVELDQRLDKRTIINYSLHASGVGSLPEVSGAISFRRGF
ncbi:MAG: autotransporter domain-containing protein [Verrucomicrobiota bacterium]